MKSICPYSDLILKHHLLYKKGMYFECGKGWFKIISKLSNSLEKEIFRLRDEENEDEQFLPFAIQVKEKNGSLSFYMSTYTDEMLDLIEKARDLSLKTCEICGKEGKINDEHWQQVRCDDCE